MSQLRATGNAPTIRRSREPWSVGNRLRVTARLSTTAEDVMQRTDVFDRHVKDVFAVEDEIADAIVSSAGPSSELFAFQFWQRPIEPR